MLASTLALVIIKRNAGGAGVAVPPLQRITNAPKDGVGAVAGTDNPNFRDKFLKTSQECNNHYTNVRQCLAFPNNSKWCTITNCTPSVATPNSYSRDSHKTFRRSPTSNTNTTSCSCRLNCNTWIRGACRTLKIWNCGSNLFRNSSMHRSCINNTQLRLNNTMLSSWRVSLSRPKLGPSRLRWCVGHSNHRELTVVTRIMGSKSH